MTGGVRVSVFDWNINEDLSIIVSYIAGVTTRTEMKTLVLLPADWENLVHRLLLTRHLLDLTAFGPYGQCRHSSPIVSSPAGPTVPVVTPSLNDDSTPRLS